MLKFHRFMSPAGEGEGGGGGTAVVDRGDDYTPPGDEAVVDKAAADKAATDLAAQIEADKTEKAEKAADKTAKTEDAPKEKDKAKDTRLPLSRHQEILDAERARRAAVETELAKYKQGTAVADLGEKITASETKVVELEKAYAKQLTDGDTDKAVATMAEIRKLEREIIQSTAAADLVAAEARAVERVRYDTTVERLEEQFPALNVDHEDFDKVKTAEVLELKEAYQLKGYTPSQALQKAVKLIMPPATRAQERAVESEARVDPAEVEKARKAAAVAKTADAIEKTPASASKTGMNSDRAGGGAITAKDALKMPYNEFVKLDEATLARMRGDEI